MKVVRKALLIALTMAVAFIGTLAASAQSPDIPDALKPWEAWATWDDADRNAPPAYNNANDRIRFWPSQLSLNTGPQTADWKITVTVFAETWVPLPGSSDVWPQQVTGNGVPIAVVERDGQPAVHLSPGRHELSGTFAWARMPQRIAIPDEIGLMKLVVDEVPIELPNRDPDGNVWLRRQRTEAAEANSITVQVYRVIEDGIPTWLHSEIELTVSGKSREEELGWILPEGWKLATVDSPIPVAVDDRGQMMAQVRAGKWTIKVDAFRSSDAREIRFATGAEPITDRELVGFQSNPEFRLAEMTGLPAVDVTQTTFPKQWRHLPVYQWDTSTTIQLDEKMRGMGMQRPEGLRINRNLWLEEDGRGFTYSDTVNGRMQQIWRLDAAASQELGAVRVNGEGQLITSNPATRADGVEIRTRNLKLEAIGKIQGAQQIPATGWQTDADSLGMTLNLPPGWRVLALFGADRVVGDWLTAWTLLDLFLLLIFGAAVFRLWGFWAGLIALLAFGLAYHEPYSPRLTWLFLLIPLALLRVVPEGTAQKWIKAWKYVAMSMLVIILIPFLGRQIQNALYPQLETPGINFASREMFVPLYQSYPASVQQVRQVEESQSMNLGQYYKDDIQGLEPSVDDSRSSSGNLFESGPRSSKFKSGNLLYNPESRIQTGPAQPDWTWNRVICYWDGPVSADQNIQPILISLEQNRIITIVRIALLLLLSAILFSSKFRLPRLRRSVATVLIVIPLFFATSVAQAQEIPDSDTLKTLRDRLLETSDAFPRAAEIPSVTLKIDGNRISMTAEIHTAVQVAVPLPGRLPAWSPVSVGVDGKPADVVCRKGDYLWTVLPAGVHQVAVESILPDVTEWEWTFLLKPRTVSIDASGWTVTGVGPGGIPEQQIFFARQQQIVEGAAAYDRKDFSAILAVDRHIESGLIWQVRSEVSRLSNTGKAVSIKIPLLAGENVLTSNVTVENGAIEVRLGAGESSFSWESELPTGEDIHLAAPETDQWVERWHLMTSPVWNISQSGLTPVFESTEENLVPVWHPWPREEVTLTFSEPAAVVGDTMTVKRVNHETQLGSRQRTMVMNIDVECSLGGDLRLELDPAAEITSIKIGANSIPVRRDGAALIIPVNPGKQTINIAWRTNDQLDTVVRPGRVTLPVESANITSVVRVPTSRWVLWAQGPTMGPAVRFWTILVFSILAALVLGSLKQSPLGRIEWVLLAIGLTQVHIFGAMIVVAWLFLLSSRGKTDPAAMPFWRFNLLQFLIVVVTAVALGVLIVVVGAGLLGNPQMFIVGNGSSQTWLSWFQPRVTSHLPEPTIVSISVWYYRLFMLFWALWLAFALLRWLKTGWKSFSHGGIWMKQPKIATETSTAAQQSASDSTSIT